MVVVCARARACTHVVAAARWSQEFDEEYPNKAPKVRFVTKMFHPNSARAAADDLLSRAHHVVTHAAAAAAVYNDGKICLDILQNQWSPIYDIGAILTSIQVRRAVHRV